MRIPVISIAQILDVAPHGPEFSTEDLIACFVDASGANYNDRIRMYSKVRSKMHTLIHQHYAVKVGKDRWRIL